MPPSRAPSRAASGGRPAHDERQGFAIREDAEHTRRTAVPVTLSTGARLGAYEILGPLGAGGGGEVNLALDTRLDRRVALKVLPHHTTHDAEAISRFRHEAFTLASLNHPNIATIHGFEEMPDGSTVLVMELVDGETLADRLHRGAMSPAEALQICAQVALALEVAHENGVIHRDVKPGNVMLGRRGLVKVLDFGLARRVSDVESGAGTVSGTPGYMSPEQVLAADGDERSDVFAVGCVLFECMAGRRGFPGETVVETLDATLNRSPDWTALPRTTPDRVRALIGRCLEKDPAARPRDMRSVRVALEEALGIRRAAALREGESYTTPHNLPAQATSFIGRDAVLRECERMLGGTRLLTLLGLGGSGKTRLALRLAEMQMDAYPDGIWFVNLAAVTDPEHVADVATAALGVPDEPGRTTLDSLTQYVRDRRMLFVVDNCEDVLEGARGLVARILAGCPAAHILATSREPLAVAGETVFAVPTLDTPAANAPADPTGLMSSESVCLFVERARGVQPDFELTAANAADVAEICRRVDGIPLALELAAARVRLLGVSQVRARLGDRFKLLARPGGGQSRQQTVLATIEWSWDHLLPPEQEVMRRLAVFTGGWTLERAVAVVSDNGDEFEVLDLLTRLVERALVVVQRAAAAAPRYRFLESVWRFALEKLEAHADHASLRNRHLDTYVALGLSAEKTLAGSGVARQVAELEPEEENILAALAWCDHAPDGARRALVLVHSVQRYWSMVGRYALGRHMLEAALARDAGNPPSPERAWAHTRAGGFALIQGELEAARAHLGDSLAFWRSREDADGHRAATVAGLGVVAMHESRLEEAWALSEEARVLYEQRGATRGVAMALHNLATIEYALARSAFGRARFEQALDLLRATGDRATETLCLAGLAEALVRLAEYDAARQRLRECLASLEGLELPRESAYAIEALAALLLAIGRPSEAARFIGAADTLRRTLNIRFMELERRNIEKMISEISATIGAAEMARFHTAGSETSVASVLAEGRRFLDA